MAVRRRAYPYTYIHPRAYYKVLFADQELMFSVRV